MDKKEILTALSFGDRVAEVEAANLKYYFVETEEWRKVFDGDCDIIYGAKGSGKSAIYSLLNGRIDDLRKKGVLFIPGENPRGQTAFEELAVDPPATEPEFNKLWKLYFLSLTATALKEAKINDSNVEYILDCLRQCGLHSEDHTLGSRLRTITNYIRRWLNPESVDVLNYKHDHMLNQSGGSLLKVKLGPVSEQEISKGIVSAEDLLKRADDTLAKNNLRLWIALDRLDGAFGDSEQLESNALRSLFKVYLDLSHLQNLRLKIFLRSDIWKRITNKGFREASHITRTITIRWNEALLLNLMMRRLLQSELFLREYKISKPDVLGDIKKQSALFYRIFPGQVDVGEKRPNTLLWLRTRTSDGTGENAPRELIHLLVTARDFQLNALSIGASKLNGDILFTGAVIKESLGPVSKARLEQTLYSEFPKLKPFIVKLEGEKASQRPQSLAKIWKCTPQEAQSKAEELQEVGFFEPRGTKESPEFWVPFLYRDHLKLIQGAAD